MYSISCLTTSFPISFKCAPHSLHTFLSSSKKYSLVSVSIFFNCDFFIPAVLFLLFFFLYTKTSLVFSSTCSFISSSSTSPKMLHCVPSTKFSSCFGVASLFEPNTYLFSRFICSCWFSTVIFKLAISIFLFSISISLFITCCCNFHFV